MVENEWRYILNSRDCHIDLDGEVMQDGMIVDWHVNRHGHKAVELWMETGEYDHARREWVREIREVLVWRLMVEAWFYKFPSNAEPYFVDGDRLNCSANNLLACVFDVRTRLPRVIYAREEPWGLVFDKRLRGKVEVVETGCVYSGPSEAAKAVGGTRSGVSLALSGRLETHNGFRFRWI